MGMFDYLTIDDNFLPEELKGHNDGWQTKSYDKLLSTLIIDKNGELSLIGRDWNIYSDYVEKPKKLDYSGEIIFYDNIDDIWYEFIAIFDNGKMIKIDKKI
jgi:hypothetical protein